MAVPRKGRGPCSEIPCQRSPGGPWTGLVAVHKGTLSTDGYSILCTCCIYTVSYIHSSRSCFLALARRAYGLMGRYPRYLPRHDRPGPGCRRIVWRRLVLPRCVVTVHGKCLFGAVLAAEEIPACISCIGGVCFHLVAPDAFTPSSSKRFPFNGSSVASRPASPTLAAIITKVR